MKIIDVSYPIEEGMKTWTTHWHPRVEISIMGRHHLEHRETRKITLGTHTGTHIDAPLHMLPDGYSLDKIPLERLIGDAVVVDIGPKQELEPVTPQDFERAGLVVPEHGRVIIRSGWYNHWTSTGFFNRSPYYSMEACEWLCSHGVKLLALDIPALEKPGSGGEGLPSPQHEYFFKHDVTLIENLTNLDAITKKNVMLIALPLNIIGSDASPARVVVLE
jgi:arylformamidase